MVCTMVHILSWRNKTMKEKLITDAVVAAPALTLPWWVQAFEEWMHFGITLITLTVVTIRLVLVLKEWYNNKQK